jgi:phytoene dehydrogenase-like protein
VEIVDHEVQTRAHYEDGSEFILYTDLSRWEEYLIKIAPEDAGKIKKMCLDMRKTVYLQPYSDPPGFRKLGKTITSMFGMMPVMALFMKYGRKSCQEYLKKQGFTNEKLNYFLNNLYGTRDFSALAFIMMFAWFNQKNAGYLIGGSLPLARRMTNRFLDLGGKLTTNTKVSKIIVKNDTAKGVILSDGTEIRSDYVISAADGHFTIFEMLEGKYLTKKISDAYDNWELFTPIVQVSFGINKIIKSDCMSETWQMPNQFIGKTKLSQGYSIMNYSFDPTMAPEGKSVVVMRYESPWDLWQDIGETEYLKEKEQIGQDARLLLEKRFPGISEAIEVIDVATPVTDRNYTGVWKGSYEGFMPTAKNLMNNIDQVIPRLKKFYMAGQWLFPGGGLPPAGQSGKWAIQFICKEEKTLFHEK